MASKRIVILEESARHPEKSWIIGNQTALERLLNKYKVDALLDPEYCCEVTQFVSLAEGGRYTLGDSFSSSVELREWKTIRS